MNKTVELSEILPLIEEQINLGGSAAFTIKGTSMEPLLYHGESVVYLKRVDSAIKKYDIILYRNRDGHFLLHRVVAVKEGGLVLRGDNQTVKEFPVSEDWVIARVTAFTRKGLRKEVTSLPCRIYERFWVNTCFIRKAKRKLFAAIKNAKKDRK